MSDAYDPRFDEVLRQEGWSHQAVDHYFREARRAARRASLNLALNFKIGRCQKNGLAGLRSRRMYRGVEEIVPLIECPRLVARSVEKALIRSYREAASYWGEGTMTNRKVGGGPLGAARIHIVYLVITEKLVRVGNELVFRDDLAARLRSA